MSLPVERESAVATASVICFAVIVNAEFSALPRILSVLAAYGLVPLRLYAAHDGNTLSFDLQFGSLDAGDAERLSWRLRSLVCMRNVLCAARQGEMPAPIAV